MVRSVTDEHADSFGGAFRRLWFAAAFSNLADGIGKVAVPLMAAHITRDPVLVAGVTSMLFLPYLLLGIPAGAVTDRLDRRTVMLWASAIRVLLVGGTAVAVASDVVGIPWLYTLVFVLGTVECAYDACAEGAVPQLVSLDRLDHANARIVSTATIAAEMLGGPVAGLLFAAGALLPFAAQTSIFLLAMAFVAALPSLSPHRRISTQDDAAAAPAAMPAGDGPVVDEAVPPAPPIREMLTELRRETAAGVVWLVRNSALRSLAVVTALCGIAIEVSQSTLVLFAQQELGVDAKYFGLYAAAFAVGTLGGTSCAPVIAATIGRFRTMALAMASTPFLLVGVSVAKGLVPSIILLSLFAAAIGTWNVISLSTRQTLTPTHLYGRVHGAWRAIVWGVLPVGAWAGGFIARHSTLRTPWLVSAGVMALAMMLAVPTLRRLAQAVRAEEQAVRTEKAARAERETQQTALRDEPAPTPAPPVDQPAGSTPPSPRQPPSTAVDVEALQASRRSRAS